MKRFKNDLTEGSVTKTLITFSIPFLLSNLMQSLYSVVDMLIVGWFSNANSIAGISIGGQVTWLVNSLISGISMGGTILIAQYIGSKKDKELHQTISTMLTVFIIAAFILTSVMLLLAKPILTAINTPSEAYQSAKDFIFICIGGTFFIFGYNAISAILRGMGDSKSPLIFITIACVNNIILDLVLVGVFKMGAAGAAISTVTSQALSMILSIIYLYKNNFIFDFKFKSFRIYKNKAKLLFKLGLPASLQDTAVNLSFIFITAIVNGFGVAASAAVGISGKFDSFAMLPASAMSMAVASMTAQNIGAGHYERGKKSMKIGIEVSLIFAIVIFIWIQVFPQSVMRIFTDSIEVINAGASYMRAFSFDFMAVSFAFCMNGFFNGCGHTTFSLINGVLSTILVRVPLAYVLSRTIPSGLFGVGLAAPLASLFSIIVGLWYIKSGRWKTSEI